MQVLQKSNSTWIDKFIKFQMTLELALALTGDLSDPAKMPCKAYALPTEACQKGWKLRQIAGSICSRCYACKGNYGIANVVSKMQERLCSLRNPQWAEAMAFIINKIESKDVFRWHDSGDLQGVWHLANIAKVAVLSPNVRFWLPTIEYDMVEDYLKGGGVIPKNLHIMLSAEYIDEPEPVRRVAKKLNMYSGVKNAMGMSWVTRDRKMASCPATTIRHKCLDCRECWSSMEVVYYIH